MPPHQGGKGAADAQSNPSRFRRIEAIERNRDHLVGFGLDLLPALGAMPETPHPVLPRQLDRSIGQSVPALPAAAPVEPRPVAMPLIEPKPAVVVLPRMGRARNSVGSPPPGGSFFDLSVAAIGSSLGFLVNMSPTAPGTNLDALLRGRRRSAGGAALGSSPDRHIAFGPRVLDTGHEFERSSIRDDAVDLLNRMARRHVGGL
jgi:hypothetical protein